MSRDDRYDDDRYENDHDDDRYERDDDDRHEGYDDHYESDHSEDDHHGGYDDHSDDSDHRSSGFDDAGSGGLYRLSLIKDYGGVPHGDDGADDFVARSYKYQGLIDVDRDGVQEAVYTNRVSGRWVTASIADPVTGFVDYEDYGVGGTTRVVGIYVDPLVEAGLVERGSGFDSQTRFENDLKNDNLMLRSADDYNGDGLQEVYWKTVDGGAYLRAVMHADGNIKYANYQDEQQMMDYLTAQGRSDAIGGII